MQTTGASHDWPTSAGSQRCLWWRMRAVVRPRCCISCCTTFDTREYAKQVFTSEVTRKAIAADGVDLGSLTVEYPDEAV